MAVNRAIVDRINSGAMTPEEFYNLTVEEKIENNNNINQEEKTMTTNKNFNNGMENLMKGQCTIAVVSRGDKLLIATDLEGVETFETLSGVYDGSKELAHLVAVHNKLMEIYKSGNRSLSINIVVSGIASHILSGRRADKLDKLYNWTFRDDRKQNNWKKVCESLGKYINALNNEGANVTWTLGSTERLFRRAWSELNKIAPKAQATVNATPQQPAAPVNNVGFGSVIEDEVIPF